MSLKKNQLQLERNVSESKKTPRLGSEHLSPPLLQKRRTLTSAKPRATPLGKKRALEEAFN
jgi:hypothetical protein